MAEYKHTKTYSEKQHDYLIIVINMISHLQSLYVSKNDNFEANKCDCMDYLQYVL